MRANERSCRPTKRGSRDQETAVIKTGDLYRGPEELGGRAPRTTSTWAGEFREGVGYASQEDLKQGGTEECWENLAISVCFHMLIGI